MLIPGARDSLGGSRRRGSAWHVKTPGKNRKVNRPLLPGGVECLPASPGE